ncbi:MAG: ABC transporter substrate-binding protein [Pseudomonadota bacterium]
MSGILGAVLCLGVGMLFSACDAPSGSKFRMGPTPENPSSKPQRIVSLDLCADQFVLKLVEPDRILAVSPDAGKDFSYMRSAATGVPMVRPTAEDVLILKPDLIVRAYGGGPDAAAYFDRLGIPVLDVGWANDIDTVLADIERMATGLGSAEKGRQLIAETRKRLDVLAAKGFQQNVLYMTPAGVTTGPGSLVHNMLETAGFVNFQTEAGWRSLPLERLAYERPDLVAAAFFETLTNHPNAWSAARHPVARQQLDAPTTVPLQGAWTACGGWFILDAVEALAGSVTE